MPEPDTSATPDRPRTIDEAISECDKHIRRHQIYSWVILAVLIGISFCLYYGYEKLNSALVIAMRYGTGGVVDDATVGHITSMLTYIPYLFMGSFAVIFGVLIAIYRFHLVEITKNEQYKLGFWRIRIAANNTSAGFQTEVRRALTESAFSFEKPRPFLNETKIWKARCPATLLQI